MLDPTRYAACHVAYLAGYEGTWAGDEQSAKACANA